MQLSKERLNRRDLGAIVRIVREALGVLRGLLVEPELGRVQQRVTNRSGLTLPVAHQELERLLRFVVETNRDRAFSHLDKCITFCHTLHQRNVVSRVRSNSSASSRRAAVRERSGSSPNGMSIASRITAATDEPRARATASTRSSRSSSMHICSRSIGVILLPR